MSAPLFRTVWFPALVARIFALLPTQFIDQWADADNVFLDSTMAAEPGFYRSRKTPYTRRIQRLCQHPWRRVNGRLVRVRKIVVKKSSQSGFTEAILNVIRWFAKFAPRNVIYAIDTAEEAANIRDRLVKTLETMGEDVLTGDEDDLKKQKLTLRHMLVWFYGSFSMGKFANKQAPFGVVDEAEQHDNGTRSVGDVESRTKNSDEGMVVVISKPENKGGVIDKEHEQGNQEICLVPCPYCGTYQAMEMDDDGGRRPHAMYLDFAHCRNLLHEWDLDRVLRETGVRCSANGKDDNGQLICGRLIPESYKEWMLGDDENGVERCHWLATHEGDPNADPEVVSQEINDLYSQSSSVSWGRLGIKIIKTKHNREARKVVLTQNFARPWQEKQSRPETIDLLRCKSAYRRGQIPLRPLALLLGADVGKSYARWAIGAVLQGPRTEVFDIAIVDYGNEIHPDGIAHIIATAQFPIRVEPTAPPVGIMHGFIDAKHRAEDVYGACMRLPERLWPIAGGGGRLWRKSFGLAPVGNAHLYPQWLRLLSFNDRDFKSELYLTRIKREVPPGVPAEKQDEFRASMPRLLLPENVGVDFIAELTNEPLLEDPETGEMHFVRKGPNHWGDCVKAICLGWRYISRGEAFTSEPAEAAASEPERADAETIRERVRELTQPK
jgi:phage terminase large subunit GpA-like protein